MLAEQFIKTIRAFEADHGLKPSDIQISPTGDITVTIDKSVLYQYQPTEKSRFKRFWSWLNDSDNSFKSEQHAQKVEDQLNQGASSDKAVKVAVRQRYTQLPIPYFSIPIPIKNVGTKIRDYANLAAQKVKVSVTFPQNYNVQDAIKQLIKVAMISDELEDMPKLPNAARRVSWNPIKWTLHGLSKFIPRNLAQSINKILPNKWIKTTRPYEWGTKFCVRQINHGFINSGLVSSLLNLTVIGPATMYMGDCGLICKSDGDYSPIRCGSDEILYDKENKEEVVSYYNGEIPYRDYTKTSTIFCGRTNRFSLFAQTRAKLAYKDTDICEDASPRNIDAEINSAIAATELSN